MSDTPSERCERSEDPNWHYPEEVQLVPVSYSKHDGACTCERPLKEAHLGDGAPGPGGAENEEESREGIEHYAP